MPITMLEIHIAVIWQHSHLFDRATTAPQRVNLWSTVFSALPATFLRYKACAKLIGSLNCVFNSTGKVSTPASGAQVTAMHQNGRNSTMFTLLHKQVPTSGDESGRASWPEDCRVLPVMLILFESVDFAVLKTVKGAYPLANLKLSRPRLLIRCWIPACSPGLLLNVIILLFSTISCCFC